MKEKNFLILFFVALLLCSLLVSATPNSLFYSTHQQLTENSVVVTNSEYIIYNPYESIDFTTIVHYKANLHTHTTQSDGDNSPEKVILHYALIGGYDILALTDHNKNTWPWSTWLTGYSADYVTNSSAYYSTLGEGILAVSGNEPSQNHHHGSLLNNYNGNGANLHESFTAIKNNEGVSLFYHPGRYINPSSKYYESSRTVQWYNDFFDSYADVLLGMEVYNCGNRYGPTFGYKGDVAWWDAVNHLRNPDDLVWGFSNDDMHNLSSHAFRNYQHFLMNALTEEELRMAMNTGSFYFSYEPLGAFCSTLDYFSMNANSFSNSKKFMCRLIYQRIHTTDMNHFFNQNNNAPLSFFSILDTFFTQYIHSENAERSKGYGQAKTPMLTHVDIQDSTITIQATPSAIIVWFDNQTNIVGTGVSIDVSHIDSNFVRAVLINIFGRTYTQPFGYEKNRS